MNAVFCIITNLIKMLKQYFVIGQLITPNHRMNQRQITEKFNTKLPKIEIIN